MWSFLFLLMYFVNSKKSECHPYNELNVFQFEIVQVTTTTS
jgi:hypothetical protein